MIGGTAWDLSHPGRVPRGSLDLLVIDEAGQFSLASTIAVSVAADRLPVAAWPPGLELTGTEGAGEVQTPLTGALAARAAGHRLEVGSRVWMLRRIKEAEANNERPFDQEDTYR